MGQPLIKARRPTRAIARWAAPLAITAWMWSSTAEASPGFPAQVDIDLGLPTSDAGMGWVETVVAPHDGCLLCHTIEAGGLNTNNAFGREMLRNGTVAGVRGSLAGALAVTEANDPLAISDIRKGINPNDDQKWLSGDTAVDPVPTYGCGSLSPAQPSRSGSVVFLASLVGAVFARVVRVKRRK